MITFSLLSKQALILLMILTQKLKQHLQQKKSWGAPKIKGVKFIKQESYAFTTCNKSFIELGALDK